MLIFDEKYLKTQRQNVKHHVKKKYDWTSSKVLQYMYNIYFYNYRNGCQA